MEQFWVCNDLLLTLADHCDGKTLLALVNTTLRFRSLLRCTMCKHAPCLKVKHNEAMCNEHQLRTAVGFEHSVLVLWRSVNPTRNTCSSPVVSRELILTKFRIENGLPVTGNLKSTTYRNLLVNSVLDQYRRVHVHPLLNTGEVYNYC